MASVWEEQISLFPSSDSVRERIGCPRDYMEEGVDSAFGGMDFLPALELDGFPLPATGAREGYYGLRHFNYWLSGLRDAEKISALYSSDCGETPRRYLDFGGASGRVARHMRLQHKIDDVVIADLNREHVNFVLEVFNGQIKAFQCSSIPHLPFEDNAFDLISAFSVFSHIETFDETWLLELRRILKPGGILVITANVDTFQKIEKTWPVYKAIVNLPGFDQSRLGHPLDEERKVFRWRANSSYSSVVYMTSEYVKKRWGLWFSKYEIIMGFMPFQSGVVFTK